MISFLVFSCNQENNIIEDSKLEDLLLGKKWNCISIKEKNTNTILSTCLSDDSFEFFEDNVCNLYSGSMVCEIDQLYMTPGTFEISNNDKSLEITFDSYIIFDYEVYEANENELILEHTLDGKQVQSKFEPEN